MKIIDLLPSEQTQIDKIAAFTYECFKRYSPSWLPDIASAKREVLESFEPQRRSRVLVNSEGHVLGWIGVIVFSNIWEIHPIAVDAQYQGAGYGRLLVNDIVSLAHNAGVVAVWAGTADETRETGFSRLDLPLDSPIDYSTLEVPAGHPVNFWRHMGFSLVAVTPDEGPDVVGIHFATCMG